MYKVNMIWNIYRLDDEKPCGRYWFCSYNSAETRAIKKYGSEVMVIDIVSDRRRSRAERDFSDSVKFPSKGGSCRP